MSPAPSAADSSMDHRDPLDLPVTPREFRALSRTVQSIEAGLFTSTLERPCLTDTVRKHAAEIAELQRRPKPGLLAVAIEQAVRTLASGATLLGIGLMAKGALISLGGEIIRAAQR